MVYLPAFTINLCQMWVNIPYMDPMGFILFHDCFVCRVHISHLGPQLVLHGNDHLTHYAIPQGGSEDSKTR